VSSAGSTCRALLDSLCQGRPGVGPLTRFRPEGFDVTLAAEVKDVPEPPEGLGRAAWYALLAANQALDDSGLPDERRRETAAIIGSTKGLVDILELAWRNNRAGPPKASGLQAAPWADSPARCVAQELGLGGPVTGLAAACASGPYSIAYAAELLRAGRAKAAVAGATDAPIVPSLMAAFANLGVMTRSNERGSTAARPFCATRDGLVLSEAAGALLLETVADARARDARIYAELAGWALAGEACHITAPPQDPAVPARALRQALVLAAVPPEELDYINAHGTATRRNDSYETQAIKEALGQLAYSVPVSSIKGITGHPMAAAGAIDAVVSVLALEHGMIPPTANYQQPDPECDLDYVPNEPRQARLRTVLSSSLGFGGHVAMLVFRKV